MSSKIFLLVQFIFTSVLAFSQHTFEGIIVFESTNEKYPGEFEKASKIKMYDTLYIKKNMIKQVNYYIGYHDLNRREEYFNFDSLSHYHYTMLFLKFGYYKSLLKIINPNEYDINDIFFDNYLNDDTIRVYRLKNASRGGLIEIKLTDKIKAPHQYALGLNEFPVEYLIRNGSFDLRSKMIYLNEEKIPDELFIMPKGIQYVDPKDYENFYFDFEN